MFLDDTNQPDEQNLFESSNALDARLDHPPSSVFWIIQKWAIAIGGVALFQFCVWAENFGYTGYVAFWVTLTGLVSLANWLGNEPYDGLSIRGRRYWVSVLLGLGLIGMCRLIWLGSSTILISTLLITIALRMSLASVNATWTRLFVGSCLLLLAWLVDLVKDINQCWKMCRKKFVAKNSHHVTFFEVLIPVVVGGVFIVLFLNANPQGLKKITQAIERILVLLTDWLTEIDVTQLISWTLVGMITLGLMSRSWISKIHYHVAFFSSDAVMEHSLSSRQPLYRVWRNTLISVCSVFLVYLVIEIIGIWTREFPVGFYYAGYAHRGAAWLTTALFVSTALLSFAFPSSRPALDPLNENLKRISWVFIGLNFILAITVYRRMWVYIEFNGLSYMRMIGILGASCVVAGLVCVILKIQQRKTFAWLVGTEAFIAATLAFVFACCPIDWVVHKYNVGRWSAGDQKPIVQVAYQPLSIDGLLAIWPLLRADDNIVREGVEALIWKCVNDDPELKRRFLDVEEQQSASRKKWQHFQGAVEVLSRRIRNTPELSAILQKLDMSEYESRAEKFRNYTYRWY